MTKESIESLFSLCKGKKVYIQTHNFPDPDAIASAFGLQKLFEKYDIPSTICHEGLIDKLSARKMLDLCNISMLSKEQFTPDMIESDVIVLVDSQKGNGNVTDLIGDEVASIDHHPTFVKIDYKYSDLRITGACASIIAEYYKILGIEPDENVATALLYGIKMDTLQFTRGVTPFDIKMFDFLFPYISNERMSALERNNMEFDDLRAYGTAIENVNVYGRTGFTFIDYACPDSMIAIISDFILSLVEIDVAVVASERPNGIKFSIRSERDDVDAGQLANKVLSEFGNGGGHAAMAGGFAPAENIAHLGPVPFTTIQDRFLEEIFSMINGGSSV